MGRVALFAFVVLVVTACSTASKPVAGNESVQIGRRQHEVVVVASDRTLFFDNARPPCPHWSVPGQWTFAQQSAALRRLDGKGFVGVALYPEQDLKDLPGADLTARGIESIRRHAARDHNEPIMAATESFPSARADAVLWRVTSTVPLPPEVTRARPDLAGQRATLPSRILVPFPSGWLTVITVSQDNLDVAREVIATLRTVNEPQCWWPILRQQFPDAGW